jgi:hypothetical protein
MAEIKSKRPTFTVDAIKSDIGNSMFLGNPVLDNVVACLISVSGEVWATKRRMKVLESLLAKQGITQEMIEKYHPTEQEVAAWEADRDAFVESSLGNLGNDATRPPSTGFATRG